ncbi:MAG: hypothetical protein AB8H03_12720 [Saprospiraceae bacterium]
MSTIQQNPLQSSPIKESEVPTLFYFILGMILVFGSGASANGQDSVPSEIEGSENKESFTIEFTNTTNASSEDVLIEMPVEIEKFSKK